MNIAQYTLCTLCALLLTSSMVADEHAQQDQLIAQYKAVKRQLEEGVGEVRDWLKNSANQNDEGKTINSQCYINVLNYLTHSNTPRAQWDSIGMLHCIDPYFYQFLEQDAERLRPLVDTLAILGKQVSKEEII